MTDKLSERLVEYFTILCDNNNFPQVETKLVDDCRALEAELRAEIQITHNVEIMLVEKEVELCKEKTLKEDIIANSIKLVNEILDLKTENKGLKEQINGLDELNHGLDYCAEESDRKRKDAEAEVKALEKQFAEITTCPKDDSLPIHIVYWKKWEDAESRLSEVRKLPENWRKIFYADIWVSHELLDAADELERALGG